MSTVIRKPYFNYEKEEKWLNEMCRNGLALKSYSWCKYTFERCEPGEYIYRLELLENTPLHPESKKYIDFMRESNVEYVDSYIRWVYFRKKAYDGEFNIYSDINSKINHYQRILHLWLPLIIINLPIGIYNVLIGLFNDYLFNITLGSINIILGLIVLTFSILFRNKVQKLKLEKNIRE